ncbi:MAG: hypothetical protein LBP53_08360 [Candidatus Peribacteria bacterium]|nr:hypothetical protein [Candidatus Peribacteria bacterium]
MEVDNTMKYGKAYQNTDDFINDLVADEKIFSNQSSFEKLFHFRIPTHDKQYKSPVIF